MTFENDVLLIEFYLFFKFISHSKWDENKRKIEIIMGVTET